MRRGPRFSILELELHFAHRIVSFAYPFCGLLLDPPSRLSARA